MPAHRRNGMCIRGHDTNAPDAIIVIRHAGRTAPERRCRKCRQEDDRLYAERRREAMARRYPNGERWKQALKTVEKVHGPHRTWVGFGHPGHRAWTAEMARLAGITLRQTQREVAP